MKTKPLSSILLWIGTTIFASISAQNHTITGKVAGSDTQQPLPGAHIAVAGTTIGTITGSNGQFTIENLSPGQHAITVSYSGYGTREVTISLPMSEIITIVMNVSVVDIDQIVVTGTRSPKPLKETPVFTQVITSSDIESQDLPDIREALERTIPGIDFEFASYGPDVKMMGLPAGYLLFLSDGNRIAGEVNNNIDYNRISTQNIDRIEIVRGASSVLYGSNAMAGVVNLITRPQLKPVSLDVYSRHASFNDYRINASLGIKRDQLTSRSSFRVAGTDGYDLNDDPEDGRTMEKSSTHQIAQEFVWTPLKNFELETRGALYRNHTDASLPERNDLMNDNFDFFTKANWYLSPKSKLEAVWHEDQYFIYEKSNLDKTLDYDNRFRNVRIISNTRFFNHSLTTIGTEYISEKMMAPRNDIEDRKKHYDLVGYIQEDARITQNLSLTGGLRVNHNSDYGTHTTWQFSAMKKIHSFTFRGNLGRGYKTPTFKEKYMQYRVPIGFPIFIYGNPDLRPETSFYQSLSAEMSLKTFNITLNVYQNELDDMITEVLQSSGQEEGMIYLYENIEDTRIRGIDLLLYYQPVNTVLISGGYSYNDAKDIKQDRQLSGERKHSAKINISWSPGITSMKPSFILQGNYMGKMDRIIYNQDSGEETIYMDLDDFTLWKLIIGVRPLNYLTIRGGVDNIFGITDKESFATFSPGRTGFVSMTLNL